MIAKSRALHVPRRLALPEPLPTVRFVDPDFVYLPVTNSRCAKGEITIQVGDHVKIGQKIGLRHGPFYEQPILATVSGTFVAVEKHYYRTGKLLDFIKIENDKKDELFAPSFRRTDEEIMAMSKDEMTEIIKETALVGLGGSSFPTYIKFATKVPIKVIMVNGIECEPLIMSDHRTMLERAEDIIAGTKFSMRAFGAKRAILCFKKKHKDLVLFYKDVLRKHPEIPLEIKLIRNYYPAGWEVSMIHDAAHINVKPGELPSVHGVMNFNVSTVVGICNALRYDLPVYERNITVSGDGIKHPQNMVVKVGTAWKDILPLCGGYIGTEPKVIVLGGPMMGAAAAGEDVILSRTVTSIIVMNQRKYREDPCIRCGSCTLSCPAALFPMQIMDAVKSVNREKLKILHPEKCVECALCAYVCTSHINVTDYVKRAKLLVRK